MTARLPLLKLAALIGATAACAGCAGSLPRHDDAGFGPTLPVAQAAPPPADGAIYHASSSLELFSDARAHRVGDILTITLDESTQASKKSATTTAKKNTTSVGAPSIAGHTLPVGGAALASLGSDNSFSGQGESSQSNQLSGELTVTVAQRLSNGNLVVRGEKWLTINQGRELVRISGIVRPVDITQENTVSSSRVADAKIAYTGRGSLADANTQGWLARFFTSKWMPF